MWFKIDMFCFPIFTHFFFVKMHANIDSPMAKWPFCLAMEKHLAMVEDKHVQPFYKFNKPFFSKLA